MKALSIRNPWAWLIVNGYKTVENRDWSTKFRGEFLIHASQGMTKDEANWCFNHVRSIDGMRERIVKDFGENVINWRYLKDNFCGGIIGKARLTHVVHGQHTNLLCSRDKPWFFGKYGFILEDMQPLPFMPYKGQLGFFDVDYDESLLEKRHE